MNRYVITLASMVCGLLCSCSDYTISNIPAYEPEIVVTPLEHDFGAINSDGVQEELTIQISNVGNITLNLDDAYLISGTSNFSLSPLTKSELEPGELTEIFVTYDPLTYETNSDVVSIWSNDEDEQEVQVPLGGAGDAPVIDVTPEHFDFGSIYLGCDEPLDITISNVGNVDLEVSDLDYFATVPVDFQFDLTYGGTNGNLPWTIAPGDSTIVTATFTPIDEFDDEAYLEVTSNDPASPLVTSSHEGLGDYQAFVTDNHEQTGDLTSDILFVIDNSGSMSSNQTNLKNNFDDFIAVFVSAGVDYQIALITTDSAEFVGDVISPLTADPVSEFKDQVDLIGYHGSAYEKGLWYSYESTDTGGDASPGSPTGFFRASAKLVIVYVSDEPDFSHNTTYHGGSTTMVPSDYSAHLLSLKTSSDLVVAHAVAGDYPSGCSGNGSASFGDGYYDVVNDLGGTFMSICATDWSVSMEAVATDSMAGAVFGLSQDPFENTIVVTVDGVTSSDWTYDSSTNTIQFDTASIPVEGSMIDISYAVLSDCNDDDEDTGDTDQ